jgi:hypothetical protein
MEQWCSENPESIEWFEPTGFRKIPLDTCMGGKQLDQNGSPRPCPNHESEFADKYRGPGGVAIFFIIAGCIGLAGAIGWYVHRNWSGKFGTIRLGETPISGGGAGFSFDSDSPLVKYPVVAISAAVAVVGAVPLVLSALWRTAQGAAERWFGVGGGSRGAWSRLGRGGAAPFTTRDSFARGRSDYAIVDEDEGELLGEDSDEEQV